MRDLSEWFSVKCLRKQFKIPHRAGLDKMLDRQIVFSTFKWHFKNTYTIYELALRNIQITSSCLKSCKRQTGLFNSDD